jgi:predicted Zn finger-like uncharacterized protein
MLLTTCPNCSAQFKVQPEQLNIRQGRVMCGRCRGVFNAFQSLARVSESSETAEQALLSVTDGGESPPSERAGGIFLREEPLPLPREFSQADSITDILPLSLAPSSAAGHSFPVPSADNDRDEDPSTPLMSLIPQDVESADSSADNPLLAPAPGNRQLPGARRTRLWSAGVIVLLLGLVAQVAYGQRTGIIQSYPQLRPVFVNVCEWAGCSLSWGRDDTAIRIEASDLIETPGKAGLIQLTATLVNRGETRQDLPVMELKLSDNANQVILDRILQPQEYLGRAPGKDESLLPNVELYVNLNIELLNKVQASGYGVRVFYD